MSNEMIQVIDNALDLIDLMDDIAEAVTLIEVSQQIGVVSFPSHD